MLCCCFYDVAIDDFQLIAAGDRVNHDDCAAGDGDHFVMIVQLLTMLATMLLVMILLLTLLMKMVESVACLEKAYFSVYVRPFASA